MPLPTALGQVSLELLVGAGRGAAEGERQIARATDGGGPQYKD